jgi:hypothetical protein
MEGLSDRPIEQRKAENQSNDRLVESGIQSDKNTYDDI